MHGLQRLGYDSIVVALKMVAQHVGARWMARSLLAVTADLKELLKVRGHVFAHVHESACRGVL